MLYIDGKDSLGFHLDYYVKDEVKKMYCNDLTYMGYILEKKNLIKNKLKYKIYECIIIDRNGEQNPGLIKLFKNGNGKVVIKDKIFSEKIANEYANKLANEDKTLSMRAKQRMQIILTKIFCAIVTLLVSVSLLEGIISNIQVWIISMKVFLILILSTVYGCLDNLISKVE